ncbi:MAG: hypothetical protein OEM01_02345 [Desulfobulbaceae bacterium]|nr:hypothetical protein [Desulfobulbaceae bacterium]
MPRPKIKHPFYPIIYVRGYAMIRSETDATVSIPYMGFNLGATKARQDREGRVIRHIFESPPVRLMKDYEYLFRNTVNIRATQSDTGWDIRYSFMEDNWGESAREEIKQDDKGFYIPLTSPKGFKGKLRLKAESWN